MSIKKRYQNISQSKWFKEAYNNKSLGEIMEIESHSLEYENEKVNVNTEIRGYNH